MGDGPVTLPDSWRLLLAALVLTGWLAAAAYVLVRNLASGRAARESGPGSAHDDASLLPAAHALLAPDGSLRFAAAVLDLFAIDRASHLGDLRQGPSAIGDSDVAALEADVERLLRDGRSFKRLVRSASGEHLFLVDGWRLPGGNGQVAGALWFRDVAEVRGQWYERERRTAELEQRLALAEALIAAAPWPIWRRDAALNLVQVNASYARAVEAASPDEAVVAQAELAAGALGQPPRVAARLVQRSGETSCRTETVIVGGARRTMELCEVPLGAGVGGFARDVTEEREARTELERRARASSATFDRLSAGIARFSPDGALTFFNQAFVRIFALEPRWLEEQPDFTGLLDRMHEARRLPEQADYLAWRNERRRWLRDAEPGEEIWALLNGSVLRVVPQPDPEGGLLLLVEDRTEQVKLQSRLDTLRRVQGATIEQLWEAVAVFGADGRLRVSNKRFAQVCALPPEDLKGEPHAESLMNRIASVLKEPERIYGLRDLIFTATTLRQARAGRVSGSGAEGRTMDYRAVPLPDGNALLVFLDVTDAERLEEARRERNAALHAARQVQSAFIASISSDLKTPLTTILGFAELLEGGYLGPLAERQQDAVAAILGATRRLDVLANDLLESASAPSRALLELTEVDVAAMLARLADELAPELESLGRRCALRIEPSAGVIETDERRLRQALRHLVTNALRAADGRAQLTLEARGSGSSVTIAVRLDGRIVAREPRAASPTPVADWQPPDALRAGLGLMLVRALVEQHGGRLELDERAGGTSVALHLLRRRVPESARLTA